MYKLLGRATSGNVQKVIFLLEELDISYERLDYGRQFENTDTPEYLAMNPTKKVPTLVDGDTVVWESNTILRYLASQHSTPFYPALPGDRAQSETWMDWLLATVNPVYLAGFKDAKKAEADRAPDTAANLAAELKILDKHLSGKAWMTGDQLTLADFALGPIIRRCINFPFDLPEFENIRQWVTRLESRPAFKKAIAAG
ncbi:MAG: glutathione S-transferase [Pusillimonas sp.]|nr:glutathione S-transferase [Pusillimonas sp.]MBC44055.1 glutathione S-transferase [Pusillimonas sp.]HCP79020.1 glutathione S-transferase family protein [Pusillimonas sp.]|tara:strand:- start:18412 stop:19008 length:597 start_codon:yes stop_codon:yes gene_type:complete